MRGLVIVSFVLCLSSLLVTNFAFARDKIVFATALGYPPFGFKENGNIVGFDIEFARMLAKEMGREAVFDVLYFDDIWGKVASGEDDAGIATLTITEERKNFYDFSMPYYKEGMVAVYHKEDVPITDKAKLAGKKVALQSNTLLETWIKENVPTAKIMPFKSEAQVFNALHEKEVDVAFVDANQGCEFFAKDQELAYNIIAHAGDGYGVLLKKGSKLKGPIDKAVQSLIDQGKVDELEKKWLMNCVR